MKNIASILVLIFVFTFTIQAQKKRGYKQQLTINQQTSLKVKQMTLVLDLSDKQQQQVTPLLRAAIAFRQAAMKKRKEARKQKKRPSSDEIYAIKSQVLDNKISMKRNMKNILNATQFETFKKMYKQRMKKKKGKEQRQRSTKK
ncbi:MAG: protein CpxP [Psychroserpens sp.]|jgi:protein CpxP